MGKHNRLLLNDGALGGASSFWGSKDHIEDFLYQAPLAKVVFANRSGLLKQTAPPPSTIEAKMHQWKFNQY